MNEIMTAEEIQRHYNAAMDSVNLLNAGKPDYMNDAEWADCVRRNVEHLKIMVGKDFWQGQDLIPLQNAIAQNIEEQAAPQVKEPEEEPGDQ